MEILCDVLSQLFSWSADQFISWHESAYFHQGLIRWDCCSLRGGKWYKKLNRMYMPSYININQKGWFCFQHLFNNFVNISTFSTHWFWSFNLDINRSPHLPQWINSTRVEGNETFYSILLETKELAWRGFLWQVPHKYGTRFRNGRKHKDLEKSPRHPSASTTGFSLFLLLGPCMIVTVCLYDVVTLSCICIIVV